MLDFLKVRIYPNKEQQLALAKNFGCCRMVWNYYLEKTNKQYQDAGKGLSYCDMVKHQGGRLIEVDRFFPSSKLCNCCKFKNNFLNLSIREWVCPNCQTYHDRDENAARNIREEGIRILSTNTAGHTGIKACGEEVRLVSASTKKHSFGKQESPVKLRCDGRLSNIS